MSCSKVFKQSQSLGMHLGGPENGFGLAANPDCCEPEARNEDWSTKSVWGGSSLFCTVQNNIAMKCHLQQAALLGITSQIQMLGVSDAFQHHVWKHRQGRSEWPVIPPSTPVCLGQGISLFATRDVQEGSPPHQYHKLFGIPLCCLLSSGSRWLWPAPWTWRTSPWTYRRASCS